MMRQIIDRTDGIPLFVEELTKTILESGLLVEDAGRFRLDRPLPPLAIPATLQDSLMARLDRLAPVKEVAQIGAAIGRDFSYTLLRCVAGRDDLTLNAALGQLGRGRTAIAPRDAAGSELQLQARAGSGSGLREACSRAAGNCSTNILAMSCVEQFPVIAETEPEVVAYHFTEAGLDAGSPRLVAQGRPAGAKALGLYRSNRTSRQGGCHRRWAAR